MVCLSLGGNGLLLDAVCSKIGLLSDSDVWRTLHWWICLHRSNRIQDTRCWSKTKMGPPVEWITTALLVPGSCIRRTSLLSACERDIMLLCGWCVGSLKTYFSFHRIFIFSTMRGLHVRSILAYQCSRYFSEPKRWIYIHNSWHWRLEINIRITNRKKVSEPCKEKI